MTLLYGRNQAGKSTLLRLLPPLGDSLGSGTGPLDMTSPSLRGVTFKELGWLGPGFESTQRLGFDAPPNGGKRPSIRVDIVDDRHGPIFNRILALSGDEVVFEAALDAHPTDGAARARYRGRCEGSPWSGDLEFSSLLPRELQLPAPAAAILEAVHRALDVVRRVQWLQASRLVATREPLSKASRLCSATGADLPILLQRFPNAVLLASQWLDQRAIASSLRSGRDGDGAPRFEVQPRRGWRALTAYPRS